MDRDDDDFVEFVSGTWARFYRIAYLLAAEDRAAAEDLLQTAMEKTYARWPKVRRMEHPEAYVRRIMVNALISRWRRPGRDRESLHSTVPEPAFPPTGDTGVVDHALVWPLVCALPDRQRAVVVLRYYEDLTAVETADVLGCSVGTVKSQAHDALRALRRGLGAAQVGEVLER
jgi:RNA polymerase sigma-70 factor (sigma-E family)